MKRSGRTEFKLYLGTGQKDAETGETREIDPERLTTFFQTTATKLNGFTLVNSLGYWEGDFEGSIILIHIGTAESRAAVKKVGAAYKAWFNQDAVYMTETLVMTEEL